MEFVEKPTRKSFVDIEGVVFGELKIIGYLGKKVPQQRWLAECSCGNTVNVDGTSVRSNLTKSCGCLRKKNGGKIPLSKEEAEELCVGFELIEYKGMKHPATFKCKDCGKFGETPLANNLRSYICECKGNTAQQKREDAFKDKGFQLLNTDGRDHKIKCMSCKTESYYSGTLEYIDVCKCKLDVSSDNPAAIYCLHNNTDNYIKVGKSVKPLRRLGEINSARTQNNMNPMNIYKVVWVSSESASYYLESLYHRKHREHRLYLEDWTGSTETFELGVESFDDFINEHKTLIDNLKIDDDDAITELEHKPKTYNIPRNTMFEAKGMWFPSKEKARAYFGCTEKFLRRLLKSDKSLAELKEEARRLNAKYEYNGEMLFLQELADKLGINRNTIWYRMSKMGMSFEEAISAKYEAHKYITINSIEIKKTGMFDKFGVQYGTYCKRIKCGWDPECAISPYANKLDNWRYNDTIYSRCNLFKELGIPVKSSYAFYNENGMLNTILKYVPDFDVTKIVKVN